MGAAVGARQFHAGRGRCGICQSRGNSAGGHVLLGDPGTLRQRRGHGGGRSAMSRRARARRCSCSAAARPAPGMPRWATGDVTPGAGDRQTLAAAAMATVRGRAWIVDRADAAGAVASVERPARHVLARCSGRGWRSRRCRVRCAPGMGQREHAARAVAAVERPVRQARARDPGEAGGWPRQA